MSYCSAPCMQICELSLVLICNVLMLLTLMCSCSKPCVRMIREH